MKDVLSLPSPMVPERHLSSSHVYFSAITSLFLNFYISLQM